MSSTRIDSNPVIQAQACLAAGQYQDAIDLIIKTIATPETEITDTQYTQLFAIDASARRSLAAKKDLEPTSAIPVNATPICNTKQRLNNHDIEKTKVFYLFYHLANEYYGARDTKAACEHYIQAALHLTHLINDDDILKLCANMGNSLGRLFIADNFLAMNHYAEKFIQNLKIFASVESRYYKTLTAHKNNVVNLATKYYPRIIDESFDKGDLANADRLCKTFLKKLIFLIKSQYRDDYTRFRITPKPLFIPKDKLQERINYFTENLNDFLDGKILLDENIFLLLQLPRAIYHNRILHSINNNPNLSLQNLDELFDYFKDAYPEQEEKILAKIKAHVDEMFPTEIKKIKKAKKKKKKKKKEITDLIEASITPTNKPNPSDCKAEPLAKPPLIPILPDKIIIPDFIADAIKKLKSITTDAGATRTFLDGGYVRDQIRATINQTRKKSILDFDLATGASEASILQAFAEFKITKKTISKDGNFNLFIITNKAGEKFELCQREALTNTQAYPTLDEALICDVKTRDFKINAFGADETGKIIDPLNYGIEVFLKNYLETILPTEESFAFDPIRMLRTIYLTDQLNLIISPEIQYAFETCQLKLIEYISAVPAVAEIFDNKLKINSCLNKLLNIDNPSSTFILLKQTNILSTLFPQLAQIMKNNQYLENYFVQVLTNIPDEKVYRNLNYIYALFLTALSNTLHLSSSDLINQNVLFSKNFSEWSPKVVLILAQKQWDNFKANFTFKPTPPQTSPIAATPSVYNQTAHSPAFFHTIEQTSINPTNTPCNYATASFK